MKLTYNILLSFLLIVSIGCEKDSINNDSSGIDLESTLDQSSITGSAQEGDIDDYFYDLDEGSSPYYNSDFYFYSGLSILQPLNFNEEEDILNYSSVTDYVLEFSPSEFDTAGACSDDGASTDQETCEAVADCNADGTADDPCVWTSLISLNIFDETEGGQCTEINDECEDLNGDGNLTYGGAEDLQRFEEINFNHQYLNLLSLEWDIDGNSRYMFNAPPSEVEEITYRSYIGDPDKCTSIGDDEDACENFIDDFNYCEWVNNTCRFIEGSEIYQDRYDSLVYIADINYNDLNGFTFTDTNENGQWDEGEPSTLENEIYSEYYFDQTELVLKDSTYSSVDTLFSHTFEFSKWILADSLIFKVSTDCNDNGLWDEAETISVSECNNGFWNEEDSYCDIGNGVQDPDEPYIDLNDDDHGAYNIGEEYLDRNCNGRWDAAEGTTASACPLVITDTDGDTLLISGFWTGSFCDLGNFQKDGDEECADGSTSCGFDDLYEMSTKPEAMIASWDSDNNTWKEHTATITENGENVEIGAGTGYRYITRTDTISPRWADQTYLLIQELSDESTKSKEIALSDSVKAIYSHPFIENMISENPIDYIISKTVWYDNDGRKSNYFLNRKDEDGDIVTLGHDSYFSLPATAPGSSIDGGTYSNYLVFDEYPIERTYLYTYGGLLRDGEYHQTYRQGYSAETFAYYDIYETYEVSYESVILPLDEVLDNTFPDTTYTLDDVFKITRTKKTVMLGPDLEVVEENKVWLAKNIGIVKDEVSFRFNEPDDFDAYYKLELSQCNHCEESNFSGRSGFFDNRVEVDINNLNMVDEFNDQYRKTRSYGIQTFPLNIEQ